MMFIYGMITMWFILGWFCYFCDNRKTGIQLFDGWATTILTLPVMIIIYPIGFALRPLYKKSKKFKKMIDKSTGM